MKNTGTRLTARWFNSETHYSGKSERTACERGKWLKIITAGRKSFGRGNENVSRTPRPDDEFTGVNEKEPGFCVYCAPARVRMCLWMNENKINATCVFIDFLSKHNNLWWKMKNKFNLSRDRLSRDALPIWLRSVQWSARLKKKKNRFH